jgi:hypothetical protein
MDLPDELKIIFLCLKNAFKRLGKIDGLQTWELAFCLLCRKPKICLCIALTPKKLPLTALRR